MHQNAFGGRALPGPTEGAYSAPPDLLADFTGWAGKWGEGREDGKEGRRKGDGRKGREREREKKEEGLDHPQ